MKKRFFKGKGITLVELLVVISIIGLLVVFGLINIKTPKIKAQRSSIISAMSELRAAVEMERNDNDSYLAVCIGGDISNSGDFGKIKANI